MGGAQLALACGSDVGWLSWLGWSGRGNGGVAWLCSQLAMEVNGGVGLMVLCLCGEHRLGMGYVRVRLMGKCICGGFDATGGGALGYYFSDSLRFR